VVITHGNGPQVGFILLRSELSRDVLHQVPLENCVADTQGAIGYQIAQTLQNEVQRQGFEQEVASVVTQVVVDDKDPGFENPSKPIGPFMSKEDAAQHAQADGWAVAEDAGRGWRRLVPSPLPLEIVELPTIRTLLEAGIMVVAVGGGGIPVTRLADGTLRGCDAVIDKDKASGLLANKLGASVLIFSTSVSKIALNFNTPDHMDLHEVTLAECRSHLDDGHFAPGSMRPKIEAAIDFLEHGGERVIVTQPHHIEQALDGIYGTHIVP